MLTYAPKIQTKSSVACLLGSVTVLLWLSHSEDEKILSDCVKFCLWPLEEPLQHMNTTVYPVTNTGTSYWCKKLFICRTSVKSNFAIVFKPLMVNVVFSCPQKATGVLVRGVFQKSSFNIRLHIHFHKVWKIWRGALMHTHAHAHTVHMLVYCLLETHIAAMFKCSCFLGRCCCGLWLKLLLPGKRSNLASL